MNKLNNLVFTHVITTSGELLASFHFTSENAAKLFIDLNKSNERIKYKIDLLPILKVGDACRVLGEGLDKFIIKKVIKFGEHRYGYQVCLINNPRISQCEEIQKCIPLVNCSY